MRHLINDFDLVKPRLLYKFELNLIQIFTI